MTGIVVVYNTKDYFMRAYESIRKFMPEMPMIIINGSDKWNLCYKYVASLAEQPLNFVYNVGYNIGHGRGLHYALERCSDDLALIFDSDIVMKKNPLRAMNKLMTPETYATGWMTYIGPDGYDYGTPGFNNREKIPYIHPYFMLLNVKLYFKFHRFVHHGAPCYKAMLDIYRRGETWRLANCELLTGHTSGAGINWTGKPNKYIQHDFGGTRLYNKYCGKYEIEGRWE